MPSRIRFRIFISILAIAVPAWPGSDAVPGTLKLGWVLAQVRQNNPEIKAARAEEDAARLMQSSARSWPDPQIGLEFWDFPRPGLDLAASGQKLLDISQEIPFPLKSYLQSEVASHAAHLQEAEAEKIAQEQLFMAKQAYWDLYSACASMKVLSRTAQALGQLASLSERRGRFGQGGRGEQLMIPMAKMEKVGLENQGLALVQERLAAQAALERLMGAGQGSALPDPEESPMLPSVDTKDILKKALEARPDLVEARHHLLHTQAQRSLAESGWMPDLMLQYSLVDNKEGPQSSMAMAKLNLPFIWFWRQGAEVSAARKQVEESQAMLQSTADETAALVENGVAMLQSARAQLDNDKAEALPDAEAALKLGLSGYQSGSLGVSDALGALRAYLMVNLEALGLQAQIGRSIAGLEQLAGGSLDATLPMEMNHE